jgi:hypothetical protein
MYITGGIGPAARNEGFTYAYDLPDETAYAETCAAIGMAFWNHRLLQFQGDGKYADVLERELYNGTISGVSLDGTKFFYENPLASNGHHHRQDWFDCACCPPNIARMIASVGGYFYSTSTDGVWTHLYASGKAEIGDWGLEIEQKTNYPWDGKIELTLTLDQPQRFALRLRVPGWCKKHRLRVNQLPITNYPIESGYLVIEREWHSGDVVTLDLDMPARLTRANPNVRQMIGRVAIERGPLVYCLEAADNAVAPLDRIELPLDAKWQIRHESELLGGVTVLRTKAQVMDDAWSGGLYASAKRAQHKPIEIVAVPYCTWDNRAPGEMRVWLRSA